MGAFLAYSIKVAICLLFLFAFTKLVFGKDTLHAFNRAVWLLIVPASLLLPLCDLGLWQYLDSGNFTMAEPLEQEVAFYSAEAAAVPVAEDNTLLPLVRWAAAVYFAGVLAMSLYFIVFYIRLFRLILPKRNDLCRRLTLQGSSSLVVPKVDMESNRKTMQGSFLDAAADFLELLQLCKGQVRYYGKVHFIVHEKDIAPFSWMNYVVVSEKDVLEDGRAILIHELSHVKKRHSWDILLMDMMILFQWFNPASWLSKRSLQQVHEYCADESVIESGIDAKTYQLLLIKKAVGQRLYSMANSFNHSKLKNRITMMLKEKSNHWAYAKCLYAIPIAFITASAFTAPQVSAKLNDLAAVKITQNSPESEIVDGLAEVPVVGYGEEATPITAVEDTLMRFSDVEVKPSFQGGDGNAFSKWVGQNLNYPEEAKKANVSGRVTLQFVIETDGTLTFLQILRAPDGDKAIGNALAKESQRVVMSSPKWTPGMHKGKTVRVTYNFPVLFQFSSGAKKDAAKTETAAKTESAAKPVTSDEPVPFALIEDKPTFMGGDANVFSKWIAEHMNYPEEARKAKVQGCVTLQFTITEDGSVSDVKNLRTKLDEGSDQSKGHLLTEEAIRVVSSSPNWTCGKQDGKPVKVVYNFPVIFQLR